MKGHPEQPYFNLDEESINHLANEDPRTMRELEELHELIEIISGKRHRRMEKIRRHMMKCSICISKQIQLGLLIPIDEYWESGPMLGHGRLPNLKRMMN